MTATLTASSVPSLWRLARLEFDKVRNQHVLLYPEGVVLLNDTGAAILGFVDGQRSVEDIAAALKQRYDCGDITGDILEYLSGLVAQQLVRIKTEA